MLPTGDEDAGAGRPSALRAQYSPFSARLIASVPPEVKTTSIGSQPSVAATVSRDSSRRRRAACPWLWMEDGLPTSPRASV